SSRSEGARVRGIACHFPATQKAGCDRNPTRPWRGRSAQAFYTNCPVAECDRGDGGRVVGKEIPGLAAFVDDVLVVITVMASFLSAIFPYVLHRIEFWRVGRQRQKADVV